MHSHLDAVGNIWAVFPGRMHRLKCILNDKCSGEEGVWHSCTNARVADGLGAWYLVNWLEFMCWFWVLRELCAELSAQTMQQRLRVWHISYTYSLYLNYIYISGSRWGELARQSRVFPAERQGCDPEVARGSCVVAEDFLPGEQYVQSQACVDRSSDGSNWCWSIFFLLSFCCKRFLVELPWMASFFPADTKSVCC